MSKYIKLEDAISKIVNTPTRVITNDLTALADRQHEIIDMLSDLPAIDIVHCEECKKAHLTYDGFCKYCEEWKDDDGNYIEVYHDGGHFCSDGERIDNERP